MDLTAYAGKVVKVAFFHEEYDSPSWSPDEQAPGWYIDDVSIWQGVPVMRPLEDFEVGWGDWSTDHGVWQVGVPTSGPAGAHSGSNVAATILDGNYPAQTDSRLVSPVLELPTLGSVNERIELRFWNWYSYHFGNGSPDQGRIQINVQTGGRNNFV